MQTQEVSATLSCSSPMFPSQETCRHYGQSLRSSPKRQACLCFPKALHPDSIVGGEVGSGGEEVEGSTEEHGEDGESGGEGRREGREQALP